MINTYTQLAPLILFISGIFQLQAWNIRQKGFFQDQNEIRQEVLAYRRKKNIHWWNPLAMARSNNLNNLANVLKPGFRTGTKALQNYAIQSKAMSWEAVGWSTLIVGTGIISILAFLPV